MCWLILRHLIFLGYAIILANLVLVIVLPWSSSYCSFALQLAYKTKMFRHASHSSLTNILCGYFLFHLVNIDFITFLSKLVSFFLYWYTVDSARWCQVKFSTKRFSACIPTKLKLTIGYGQNFPCSFMALLSLWSDITSIGKSLTKFPGRTYHQE